MQYVACGKIAYGERTTPVFLFFFGGERTYVIIYMMVTMERKEK